jgi:glucose-6-phosphate dehydrogenase assembly protein OpcA
MGTAQRTLVWEAEDASLPDVEQALRRTAAPAAEGGSEPALARARALTLVVVAEGEDEGRADAVAALALRHPLRAILVARLPGSHGPALSARVRRHVRPGQGRGMLAEEADLRVRGELADHLGQLLSPLLLPELPALFWWVGAPPLRQPVFAELRALCDRGIVELGRAEDLPAAGDPQTLDELTWRRQAPLRERVASLFDPPAHRAAAGEVRTAEIAHGEDGRLAACLLGGWIASRLQLPAGAVRLRTLPGASPRGVAEVALTTGGGDTYSLRASADGGHASLRRPGAAVQRVRLDAPGLGDALDGWLAGPPDPLWPSAWRAACAVAAEG